MKETNFEAFEGVRWSILSEDCIKNHYESIANFNKTKQKNAEGHATNLEETTTEISENAAWEDVKTALAERIRPTAIAP